VSLECKTVVFRPGSAHLNGCVVARAHCRANHAVDVARWNHVKDVALQRAHLHHFVQVLMEQIDVQVLGVEA